ncbi:MAG TPA: SMI1/KNR4 family protein [Deinococcales bacterium]|nr:SMI1/KNR4 family protein [Deinococcales bacterium]
MDERHRLVLEELLALVPAGAAPLVLPPSWWSAVEAALGTALPGDYKALVARYGDRFGRGFHVYSPFAGAGGRNLNEAADDASRVVRERAARSDARMQSFPYRLYPECDGLLLWGSEDSGLLLFWLTGGDPDAWPVVVVDPRNLESERFDMPAASFLRGAVTRRLHSRILPGALPWPQAAGGEN